MNITITLTPAEAKAIACEMPNVIEWAEYTIKNRCRIAMDSIIEFEVQRKLAAGEPITGSRDEIVLAADVPSAADRIAAEEAARAAKDAGQDETNTNV